jgi:predicted nuclease with TOPRIM domain
MRTASFKIDEDTLKKAREMDWINVSGVCRKTLTGVIEGDLDVQALGSEMQNMLFEDEIEDLRDDMAEIEREKEDARADIEALEAKIERKRDMIDALDERKERKQARIESIQERRDEIRSNQDQREHQREQEVRHAVELLAEKVASGERDVCFSDHQFIKHWASETGVEPVRLAEMVREEAGVEVDDEDQRRVRVARGQGESASAD